MATLKKKTTASTSKPITPNQVHSMIRNRIAGLDKEIRPVVIRGDDGKSIIGFMMFGYFPKTNSEVVVIMVYSTAENKQIVCVDNFYNGQLNIDGKDYYSLDISKSIHESAAAVLRILI